MKVFGNDPNVNPARLDETRNRERVEGPRTDRAAPAESAAKGSAPQETVAVSTVAREVGKVNAQVRNTPDVRKEKIQAIKEKVDKGEYYVPSDKIAGKIIEDIVKQGR